MLLLTAAIVVGLCGQASAWGRAGHKIVCTIAFQLAAPATRAEIRRLMALDSEFAAFEDSCSWPDHPRQRSQEHTVHLPRTATGLRADCPLAGPCVVTAIERDLDILSAKSASDHDKLAALKFLAHWVGDIHQPLHAAFRDDRVGTQIAVVGACAGTMHTAWDACLVSKGLGSNTTKVAADILASLTPAMRTQWSASRPRDWANESFAIARHAETKYCVQQGRRCERAGGSVDIDAAYVRDNAVIVRERLARAGARLAHLLDSAFAK